MFVQNKKDVDNELIEKYMRNEVFILQKVVKWIAIGYNFINNALRCMGLKMQEFKLCHLRHFHTTLCDGLVGIRDNTFELYRNLWMEYPFL